MKTTRRNFLSFLGATGLALPALGDMQAFAYSLAPDSLLNSDTINYDNTVLVIVRLFGGNDGLNTVVPYTDADYYKARQDGKYDISIKPEVSLKLKNSSTTGLHPAMKLIQELYDEDKVLIVQNVGYPAQDLSHFRSNEIWLTASEANVYEKSGWLGRFLEERYPDYPNILPDAPFALEMGRSISRALTGRKNTTLGISFNDVSFIPKEPAQSSSPFRKAAGEIDFINQMLRQSNTFLNEIVRVYSRTPQNKVPYSEHDWSQQFAKVARLIAGGLKTRLYLVNTALWDFHHNQLHDQSIMLKNLSEAIYSFQRDIEAFDIAKRVVVLTISEFGRRLETTQSGTDHGGASSLMLVGDQVNAGILGHEPDCSHPDENGNIRWQFDFRQIYASLLGQWLGAKSHEISPIVLPHLVKELPLIKHSNVLNGKNLLNSYPLIISSPFPNPASHQVSCLVRVSPKILEANQNNLIMTIHDILGKPIQERVLKLSQIEQEVTIDVSRWASGRYILQVKQNSFISTQVVNVLR